MYTNMSMYEEMCEKPKKYDKMSKKKPINNAKARAFTKLMRYMYEMAEKSDSKDEVMLITFCVKEGGSF